MNSTATTALPNGLEVKNNLKTEQIKFIVQLTLIYTAVTFLIRLPALIEPWWYQDDFALITNPVKDASRSFEQARPFMFPIFVAIGWLTGSEIGNMLVRYLELILYALSIAVAMEGLRRFRFSNWTLGVLGLIWLCRPFADESILWHSAFGITLATLFALVGARLIIEGGRRSQIAGVALVALAGCSHQTGIMAALCYWAVWLGLETATNQYKDWRAFRAAVFSKILFFLAGFVITGIVFVICRLLNPNYNRSDLTDNPLQKIGFIFQANNIALNGYQAPFALVAIWLLLLAGPLYLITQQRYNRSYRSACFALPLLALNFIIPYLPNLLTREDWPSFRTMHNAPLLLISVVALLLVAFRQKKRATQIVLGLAGVIIVSYSFMAFLSAQDYPYAYKKDLEVLRQIEQSPEALTAQQVYVAVGFSINLDPYKVHYVHTDHILSSWHSFLTVPWFIEARSTKLRHFFERDFAERCGTSPRTNNGLYNFSYLTLPKANGLGLCILPS